MGLNVRRFVCASACAAALLLEALTASSQGPAQTPAEARFLEGVELMEKGQLDRACPTLEESLTLDPRPGTLFALADCEAQRGRIATALRRFTEYLEAFENMPAAQKAKHAERSRMAQTQKEALGPVVPRLTVVLPPDTPAQTSVMLDGNALTASMLGAPMSVDPGDHLIITQVPGGPQTETALTLLRGQSVEITAKVRAAPPPPAAPPMILESMLPEEEPSTGPSKLRVAAIVSASVGGVGLLVGGIAGGIAMSRAGTVKDDCVALSDAQMSCKTAAGIEAGNAARSYANASTVGFVVGAAGVVAGSILFAIDGRSTKKKGAQGSAKTRTLLGAGPTGLGISIEGAW